MRLLIPILALLAPLFATVRGAEPNIRVAVQFIELTPADLTKVLDASAGSGTKLHAAARGLVRSGKAKLLDTAVISAPTAERSTVESVMERIYPTEEEPNDFPNAVGGTPETAFPPVNKSGIIVARPVISKDWDTRNVGMTFEAEASYDEDSSTVKVRVLPEWVAETADVVWMAHKDEWGDASLRLPTFTTLRYDGSLVLKPGRFALAGVVTPQPEPPPPALARKVLVFVRADLPRQ